MWSIRSSWICLISIGIIVLVEFIIGDCIICQAYGIVVIWWCWWWNNAIAIRVWRDSFRFEFLPLLKFMFQKPSFENTTPSVFALCDNVRNTIVSVAGFRWMWASARTIFYMVFLRRNKHFPHHVVWFSVVSKFCKQSPVTLWEWDDLQEQRVACTISLRIWHMTHENIW